MNKLIVPILVLVALSGCCANDTYSSSTAYETFTMVYNLTRGFMTGTFSELMDASTANCFSGTERFFTVATDIQTLVDYGASFKNVMYLIKDVIVAVVMAYDDCRSVGTSFTNLYERIVYLFVNFEDFWLDFSKNILVEALSFMGNIDDIKDAWADDDYYLTGQYVGNLLWETFLKDIEIEEEFE